MIFTKPEKNNKYFWVFDFFKTRTEGKKKKKQNLLGFWKAETKQEATDLMYQFRYYCLLPFDYTKDINDLEGAFQKQKEEIQMQLVQKVYDQKITNEKEAVEELFSTRAIELPKWHKFAKKGGKNI